MKERFTPVIEKHGRWYVAYVREIPGVNTQGRTRKSARRNLAEALALISAVNREHGIRTRKGRKL
jgi:predicted RNase H-like HicB family nuclease